jgi:hypothetical protein
MSRILAPCPCEGPSKRGDTALTGAPLRSRGAEAALVIGIGALGVALRLAWIKYLPTLPVSDFASVLEFANALARDFAATDARQWYSLSPGASILLSLGLRFGIASPADTARVMTAVMTGLIPLIPVIGWRGIAPYRVRATTGLLLAVWPGQVFFSGVLAQDNWAILPTVALGVLACRTLADGRARPIASAALLGLAFLMRQEMLVALAPLALAGAGLVPPQSRRSRLVAGFGATLAAVLLLVAAHRYAGSGRFALTTTHGSLATLCSAIPGSSWAYNASPYSYLETFAPGREKSEVAFGLVKQELRRRPLYHSVRAFYFTFAPVFRSSRESMYWSLGAHVLPDAKRGEGARVLAALRSPLTGEMLVVVWAGFAALLVALASRNTALLLLALAVALKVGVHALTVNQPRYIYPVTALILLAAPLAAWVGGRDLGARRLAIVGLAAVLCTAALSVLTGIAERWTCVHDTPIEYRFTLWDESGEARLRCRTANAGIWSWYPKRDEKAVSFFRPDVAPGDVAEAACEVPAGSSVAPAALEIAVSPDVAQGLFELSLGRDGQFPAVVGSNVLAGGQPVEVPLVAGPLSRITVRLRAGRDVLGRGLGHAATMTLRLRKPTPAPPPDPTRVR